MSVVCDSTHSVAMSASQTKLPASNITCRYWATSGTCFFGDQCNFAHNAADRAASGKSVPKSEKACKELLLTGFCKKENNGCEYNHDIPGVTPSRLVFLFFLSVLHFVIFFQEPERRILSNLNPPD
jgi:hypothetical protein